MNRNVVARFAVAAIGAIVLLGFSWGAVSAFRSAVEPAPVGVAPGLTDPAARRELARIQHAQFECVREELERTLPARSTVYVPLDPGSADPDLWKQRLTEMAFPLATVVDEPGDGTITLTVVPDATGDGCTGVQLVASPGTA